MYDDAAVIHSRCLIIPIVVYLPVPLFSCIPKPLLKCQYCPRYPLLRNVETLALCHFIFTVKSNIMSPQVESLAKCNTFTLSVPRYTPIQRETSWNCLISPSFNYLPRRPWDRAKGCVNERGINRKERQGICSPSPLPALFSTHHLFPSFLRFPFNGQWVRLCTCLCM